MFARLPFKSAVAGAALATAGLLLAPATASAQAYSYSGPQNYGGYAQPYDYDRSRYGYDDRYGNDDCRGARNERQTAGGVVGATIGAVAGSQLAARGRRTEGSILGGVLGAVVGAGVGGSSARDCDSRYGYDYDRSRSDGYRYGSDGYQDRGYQSYDRYETYPARSYDYDRYGSDRDRYDRGYANQSGYQSGYGCRTVETRTRTRDGRVVTRYEQSCPDRY